ncbi:MAG: hypothetical protein M1832_005981 [Thelocarpon impressellum]|nr:MAG: hypothetical protein M1832_005981 [Thelocarpon impressellum]
MRLSLYASLLVCLAFTLVVAWSKEDHEIFRLKDQVAALEGPDVTFYDFIGVKPSAGQDDITKAYRKKSKLIHPDKVKQTFLATNQKPGAKAKAKEKKKPGVHVAKAPSSSEVSQAVKEAGERFTQLGLVAAILRGPERERYDHFLANGFPRWRGTGYYYARFRPGLGSVLLGLFIVAGGGAHYGALYLSWKRQRDFVGRYIRHARRAAWGDELGVKGIPGVGPSTAPASVASEKGGDMGMQNLNRRQRRMQEKESKKSKGGPKDGTSTPVEVVAPAASGPTGEKKRVTAENGKVLIVDSLGNVYMEQENEDGESEEYLLDVEEIPKPTIRQTALVRLPVWLYRLSVGKALELTRGGGTSGRAAADEADDTPEDSSTEGDEGFAKVRRKGTNAATRRAKRNGRGR